MEKVVIVPIGEIDPQSIAWLIEKLHLYLSQQIELHEPIEMPLEAYDPSRKQYYATAILKELLKFSPTSESKMLGITREDLYAQGLYFVFGEAFVDGRAAVISMKRLYPEFYRQPADPPKFGLRMAKEAIHEIGHTLGLNHCPDIRCIMHYSNSIEDTDRKGPGFCPDCLQLLTRRKVPAPG